MVVDKFKTVINRVDGFNEVNAFHAPNGDLIIVLGHSNCNDEDVMLRITDETNVELCGALDLESQDDPWEDETTVIGRINHGGDWNA